MKRRDLFRFDSGAAVSQLFFVALSGHEVGLLGIDPYIKRRPDLITRAHAWISSARELVSATAQSHPCFDDALEQWTIAALEKEGLKVNARVTHDRARSEVGRVRFVPLPCDSEVYHNVADRWPEAVDIGLLARYASVREWSIAVSQFIATAP
jgi:hypothetical protein